MCHPLRWKDDGENIETNSVSIMVHLHVMVGRGYQTADLDRSNGLFWLSPLSTYSCLYFDKNNFLRYMVKSNNVGLERMVTPAGLKDMHPKGSKMVGCKCFPLQS